MFYKLFVHLSLTIASFPAKSDFRLLSICLFVLIWSSILFLPHSNIFVYFIEVLVHLNLNITFFRCKFLNSGFISLSYRSFSVSLFEWYSYGTSLSCCTNCFSNVFCCFLTLLSFCTAFFFDAELYADLEFLEGGPISTLEYCFLVLKGHVVCKINTSFKIYLIFKYTDIDHCITL